MVTFESLVTQLNIVIQLAWCVQGLQFHRSRVHFACRWFEAMEQKPSYLGTRSDFYTHVHDLPPQLGGKTWQRLPNNFAWYM